MAARIAMLLFGSGLCALVYQTAWLREFRLVFGASTAASAAVLSIFVGGLGMGGLLIGPRADRHPRPLWLYAQLEALIALSTACTPGLLWLVRQAYVAVGGTVVLGEWLGAGSRLLLASLVLAVPTFLMGGTLPAAARAPTSEGEQRRGSVALLYGINTLGAVVGAFASTFYMFEAFGTRQSLWLACLVNLLVAMVARNIARGMKESAADPPALPETAAERAERAAPVAFVLAAAGIVGLVFFLMELVWYRMLAPLLGGSVYTFGLVLSVALLGIGLGGWAFALIRRDRPATMMAFVYTCLLEAAFIALPFALGDRIAVAALLLRATTGVALFWGHVTGWAVICAVVVLPTAIVAGYQFPLLVALLGRGRAHVGREVGRAYACNTAGAIVGSLAGGFGLIPYLSALGTWRAAAAMLLVLGLVALLLGSGGAAPLRRAVPALALAGVVSLSLTLPLGPTSAWRHSSIGAGRGGFFTGPSALEAWLREARSSVQWDADGVESSVAVAEGALFINGKSDGHIRGDASTMIMSGLLGPLLHPDARRGLIIGLGTGESAGWMAKVDGIETVDVVELEPLVLRAARGWSRANLDALDDPRVHVTIGDAREKLLVSKGTYDIIFSEPSNPYRAGVASLFTREYYEAVAQSLGPDGLFLQWIQAYEVDPPVVRSLYATLGSVFPSVQTWRVGSTDLALIASMKPIVLDVERARRRLAQEPYRRGVRVGWGALDLESALAWFVGDDSFSDAIAADPRSELNTDDRNVIEFGFARSVGRTTEFGIPDLRRVARERGEDRPATTGGSVDWRRVDEARIWLYGIEAEPADAAPEDQRRLAAFRSLAEVEQWAAALNVWREAEREPRTWQELLAVAEGLAWLGDDAAAPWIEQVRALEPTQAHALDARLHWSRGESAEAARALDAALTAFGDDPWPPIALIANTIALAPEIAPLSYDAAEAMRRGLAHPFAGWVEEPLRRRMLSAVLAPDARCRDLVEAWGDGYPWEEEWLEWRRHCFAALGDPRLGQATRELEEFRRMEPERFEILRTPRPAR